MAGPSQDGDGAGGAGVAPRLFTIPPGAPFLDTLVDAVLTGRVIPGFAPLAEPAFDPLRLADLTVLVPTRRAARVLRGRFLDRLGARALLLPTIRPLGDLDEDGDAFRAGADDLDLPPVIGEAERLIGMARLVSAWRERVGPSALSTPHGAPIRVPASPADAVHLARDLLALMDEAANEEVDWRALAGLVPDDHAAYWQLTLTFLTIATANWPQMLAERGLIEPPERRRRLALRMIERIRLGEMRGPVVAAGSTGSIPTTAALLAEIARLPNGAVVLPGLDRRLDAETFDLVAPPAGPGVPSHPQAALGRLLRRIGVSRADVVPLGAESVPAAARADLLSEAMRPAETTDRWPDVAAAFGEERLDAAGAGLTLLAARNPAEEALAIAALLRESVERADHTAALVTPDRDLARRVSIELRRFGLAVEDSAGEPLERTAPAVLARLAAEAAIGCCEPATLLALLKHPLAAFGLPRAAARAAARVLEIAVLRGPKLAPGSAALLAALERRRTELEDGTGRPHPALRRIGAEGLRPAIDLADRIAAALAPLEERHAARGEPLETLVAAHVAVLKAVAADETGSDARLYEGPAGEGLAAFFADHLGAGADAFPVDAPVYPAVLAALMEGRQVRRPAGPEARVFIWGALEARLMAVDRVVLGSLIEGVWPARTETGPWLSRPMRGALAFAPPERRIGLAAHDFVMRCGAADVVLAWPEKRDGAPTVPSRWLKRLEAVTGEARWAQMRARGDVWLDLARRIDEAPRAPRLKRAEARPPVAARPRSLSVTEIETWIRDPYAIYARRVLALEPFDPIGRPPDFATRGTVVHDALADFAATWHGPFDESAVDALVAIGRRHFAAVAVHPEVHALWWPRFVAIARFVVEEFEAGRAGVVRHPEVSGRLDVPCGAEVFTLTGRADRIDVGPDGRATIVDFKTGAAPSEKQIATLLAPQLPLEAAMLEAGVFAGLGPLPVASLEHVVLKGIAGKDEVKSFAGYTPRKGEGVPKSLDEVVAEAARQLGALVAAYFRPERSYVSRPRVQLSARTGGPYDHLARVKEWQAGGDDEGEGP